MPISYKISHLNRVSCVSVCFIAPDFIACSRRSDSGAPMKNGTWKKNANIAPLLYVVDLFRFPSFSGSKASLPRKYQRRKQLCKS